MDNDPIKDAFCTGFAYGCRYGHEEVLHGEMEDKDVSSAWLLAMDLYKELFGPVVYCVDCGKPVPRLKDKNGRFGERCQDCGIKKVIADVTKRK